MKYNYAFKSDKENIVKIVGRDLGISTKQSIELCSFIKNKPVAKVTVMLEKVKDKKLAVPFKRFTEGAGHKKGLKGVVSGKYPFKASKTFLGLLKALEANAQNKGLSPELMIIHACAQKASTPMRYGRKRRISMKRTHVEIVAEEMEPVKKKEAKKDEKKEAKEVKKTEPVKKELPKEEKKAEPKKEEVKKAPPAPEAQEKKVDDTKEEVKKEVKKEEVKQEVKKEPQKEVKKEYIKPAEAGGKEK